MQRKCYGQRLDISSNVPGDRRQAVAFAEMNDENGLRKICESGTREVNRRQRDRDAAAGGCDSDSPVEEDVPFFMSLVRLRVSGIFVGQMNCKA